MTSRRLWDFGFDSVPSGACLGVLDVVTFSSDMLECVLGMLRCHAHSSTVYVTCVSGGWRVSACRIPARAATTSHASLFIPRHKCCLALADVGFPVLHTPVEGIRSPKRPNFLLVLRPPGVAARVGPQSTHRLPPPVLVLVHKLELLVNGVVLDASDAE